MCGLTFEVTPTVEAGAVRPGCDHATTSAARPYSACRSGSALTEGLGITGQRTSEGFSVLTGMR
jgi:hypothetical protein